MALCLPKSSATMWCLWLISLVNWDFADGHYLTSMIAECFKWVRYVWQILIVSFHTQLLSNELSPSGTSLSSVCIWKSNVVNVLKKGVGPRPLLFVDRGFSPSMSRLRGQMYFLHFNKMPMIELFYPNDRTFLCQWTASF